jgi:hypothetical protein
MSRRYVRAGRIVNQWCRVLQEKVSLLPVKRETVSSRMSLPKEALAGKGRLYYLRFFSGRKDRLYFTLACSALTAYRV